MALDQRRVVAGQPALWRCERGDPFVYLAGARVAGRAVDVCTALFAVSHSASFVEARVGEEGGGGFLLSILFSQLTTCLQRRTIMAGSLEQVTLGCMSTDLSPPRAREAVSRT